MLWEESGAMDVAIAKNEIVAAFREFNLLKKVDIQ